MYQMLGKIFKLSSSARNRGLCLRRQVQEQRLLSTWATPYLLLCKNNAVISSKERVMSIDLFDPRKQETVKIPEQRVSKEVQESVTIGSSRGWVGLKNIHDSSVRLTNIFNPCASASSRKVVSLPPLDVDSRIGGVSSLALSASPDDEGGDCVVAVSFFAQILGLCRPGDSEWTYIKMNSEEAMSISKVMYSVKDQKFYLDTTDETGLITSSSNFPPVSPYPRLPTHQCRELLNLSTELQNLSCYATPYLVETLSGESLIVFWVRENFDREKLGDKSTRNTKSFIVFRRDQDLRSGSFTRDIGNLCIFLGENEAFCVSTTDYPGLHPNSVYFGSFDSGFGFYDLASLTLHDLTGSAPASTRYLWLAPLH